MDSLKSYSDIYLECLLESIKEELERRKNGN